MRERERQSGQVRSDFHINGEGVGNGQQDREIDEQMNRGMSLTTEEQKQGRSE